MATFWIKGVDLDNPDEGLPIDRAIVKLTDEITAVHMMNSHGRQRELSMCITKLQEARLWAVAYGEATGSHAIIPRAEIMQKALESA